MTDLSLFQSGFPVLSRSRSMGIKLIMVCGLALLMVIPSFFVGSLVDDRSKSAQNVVDEISGHVGGPQSFLGPTLVIPYTIPAPSPATYPEHGNYLVFPTVASADLKTTIEERHRSLFKVPVFHADLKLEGTFDLTGVPAAAPTGAELDWSRAEIVVGVSDPRGALGDATLAIDGAPTQTLVPATTEDKITVGHGQDPARLMLFGAKAVEIAKPGGKFHAISTLKFSGAQRIAVLGYGKTTHLAAQGDWPSPGFDGAVLPISHTLSDHGFTAEWSLPFMARGVRAEGTSGSITGLDATALGVSFIEVADPYQSVDRSLKYVLLFIGLIFLSYFIFEITSGKRVHPAQYLLVGVAQIIFYLLLLSFAERIGFGYGFLLAGGATVSLLAANAGWIFASRLQALRAFVVFSLLYSLIYILLTLEDNALLVGAIASFALVAAAMYFTRSIDWYGSPVSTNIKEPPPMPSPAESRS